MDLIFSKTKLVPNKQITIPRLATSSNHRCTVHKFVQKELKIELSQKHIWVDSQCVINWINSMRTLRTFVENRVKEIKQDKHLKVHYISTTENPADIACRGMRSHELKDNGLWWHGPKWLTQSNQEWPEWQHNLSDQQKQEAQSQTETEYRKSQIIFEAKLVAGEGPIVDKIVESKAPFGINIERFSSLTRLLRVTALAERFINKLRKTTNKSGPLDESEIAKAELLWTTYLQRHQYSDVIESIETDKPNNLKIQLGIRMDTKGLLRCHGRLENAEISEGARQPIVLPNCSRNTELTIDMYHRKALHTGIAQTLSLVRQKF